jgi:hypothetical protein
MRIVLLLLLLLTDTSPDRTPPLHGQETGAEVDLDVSIGDRPSQRKTGNLGHTRSGSQRKCLELRLAYADPVDRPTDIGADAGLAGSRTGENANSRCRPADATCPDSRRDTDAGRTRANRRSPGDAGVADRRCRPADARIGGGYETFL